MLKELRTSVEGLGWRTSLDVRPIPQLRCRTHYILAFNVIILRRGEQNRQQCVSLLPNMQYASKTKWLLGMTWLTRQFSVWRRTSLENRAGLRRTKWFLYDRQIFLDRDSACEHKRAPVSATPAHYICLWNLQRGICDAMAPAVGRRFGS